MRNLFLNHLILVCIVLYSAAMAGVDYAAHQIVGRFGIVAGLAVIAACPNPEQIAIRFAFQ